MWFFFPTCRGNMRIYKDWIDSSDMLNQLIKLYNWHKMNNWTFYSDLCTGLTSWSARWLPGNLTVMKSLQEVTVCSQKIVWHVNLCKTTTCLFYTLVFVQIKHTRYKVSLSEFRGADRWILYCFLLFLC